MKLTQAQEARLAGLANKRGQLRPRDVVKDAKAKTSPLHPLFKWDLRTAAEQYWIQRAREIIGAVEVVVTTNESTIRTPMYIRDPEAEGDGYRAVASLKGDPVNARESLIYTLEIAAGHLRRALDLAQPLGLAHQVDALIVKILGVQRVIRKAA